MYKPATMKAVLVLLACFIFSFAKAQPVKFSVFFAHDVHTLDAENAKRLDSFAGSLQQQIHPLNLTITGHCDSTGNEAYNMALSQRRIRTVKGLLLNRLDNAPVISSLPKGENEPMADNGLEEGRMQNRRVDISYEVKEEIVKAEPAKPAKDEPLKETVKKSTAGQKIVLKNMNFYGGMHRLLPSSEPILQELLQVMKDNPTLEIDIQGHICCVQGPDDGLDVETNTNDLSLQRAKVIYLYLTDLGIDPKRVSYRGYGHQYPLTQERTPDEQETNRRVEIRIVKK